MAKGKVLGKSLLLLLLIVILVLFGLLWFDYLGVIQAKSVFAPVYKVLGLKPQTSTSASSVDNLVLADLDNDRFAKRLQSLDIRTEELDKREQDIALAEDNNAQIAQQLEDLQKNLDEQQKTFNNEVKKYDDRNRNIEGVVENLEGMQPANAVQILLGMDDQLIIDVLRKAEENHKAEGTSSMVAYWLSLMPEERAAEIERKSVNKPLSLD